MWVPVSKVHSLCFSSMASLPGVHAVLGVCKTARLQQELQLNLPRCVALGVLCSHDMSH